ncbi:MAG: discoidin domain-containing protein [Clostridia bacterium]|nr:discoidin domain-containing protein [Clostridia bacterium]
MSKKGKLFAVANAHLDTQWNWTVVDTIRDSLKNTQDYNFRLFKKYPCYQMNFEGAFRYKLMKEYYPKKYAQLKKYVAQGRWNVVGAAWDAMDVNVPSGEALIRQILIGNNYFEKEFGKTSEDIFLPDCFGFRASLPSIEAHMGLIGFSTQKLVWGAGSPLLSPDGKVLPPMPKSDLPRMDLGRWLGPDGKGVFVSLLEGNYTYNFDWDDDQRPVGKRDNFAAKIAHNEKYAGVARRSMYYGTGDYGGSPSETSVRMLQEAVDANATNDYEVIPASPTDVFKGLTKKEIDSLPVYVGGLLIPHGYGAMTSHTAMKRLNRRNEMLADRTERASSFAEIIAGAPYPKERIDEGWKTFLWHQFHDDLTGTSIAPAYVFSHNDELLAANIFAGELQSAMEAVAGKIDTRGKGDPYVVFNPSAFAREALVRLPFEGEDPAVYSGKKRLPTAKEDGYAVCRALLEPGSFTVLHVRSEKHRNVSALKVGKTLLENECVRVRVNKKGEVYSIFDKRLSRELLSAPVAFEIYGDHSVNWPSWEYVFEDLQKRPAGLSPKAEITVIDRRPVWVGLKIAKKKGESTFETVVRIEGGSARVLFDNRVFWYERASNLFVRFPLTAENEKTLFDCDPGAVEGGITDTYPYFMHNVHVWADQKDKSGAFGVLISNDCKYGMIKKDEKTLGLALIHTPLHCYMPQSGQDYQDFGLNIFSFALEGYGESREKALHNAEALNAPLSLLKTGVHKGSFKGGALLRLVGEGAAVTAVKKEEKGDKLIVRVRETEGREEKGLKLEFPAFVIEKAELCDGYERVQKSVRAGKNAFTFDLAKYEMKTFALTLKKRRATVASRPVALEYTDRIFTKSGEKAAKKGVYLPYEMSGRKFTAGGVSFSLKKGGNDVLVGAGQTVRVREGAGALHLLAASAGGRKNFTFKVGGKKVVRSIPALNAPVGSIESAVSGTDNFYTAEPVAAVFTHTHDENGKNRIYDFAYLFDIAIPTNGNTEIVLPKDRDLLVFSAAEGTLPAYFEGGVYDDYGTSADTPTHTLTVEHCAGSGDYKENALIRLFAPLVDGDELFTGFEGEGIVEQSGQIAIVRMGKSDMKVRAAYRKLGKDLARGKPAKANHEMNEQEIAAFAFDGKPDTKWCGSINDKGVCTLTVDLEKVQTISSYMIIHAGTEESKLWNTSAFEVRVKTHENDRWTTVDRVKNNRADLTERSFEPVKARYVQLYITKPACDGDLHARIFGFRIFR